MLNPLLLTLPWLAHAQGWPDVTKDLPVSRERRADAAVIVGVSDYFQIADVPGAVESAQDWRRYLVSRGVPLASIRLLANGEATREAMLHEAKWAAGRVQPGGKVWFVYIGHGAPAPDGRDGLLVGVDAQGSVRSLTARSARRGELMAALRTGERSEAVVVLDACFSGETGSSTSIVEGLQPIVPTYVTHIEGVTVLSAGKTDEFAGPLPGLGRPAFSYLVLGALRGWGDGNADGEITAIEAAEYARGALSVLVTDRRQQPEVSGANPQVVLGTGREPGPDLLSMAESFVDWGPERPVLEGGDGRRFDRRGLDARVRQRECQLAADAEAVRIRDASLRREGASVEATLTSRWEELKATSERCAEVQDAGLRQECRQAVNAFLAWAADRAAVTMTVGEHEVSTPCGALRGLAPEAELSVAEDLLADIRAFETSYEADSTRGTSATVGGTSTSAVLGTLKWIPAGTFIMGSPRAEQGRESDEEQYRVTLPGGFWMMEREVTQGMWRRVMRNNPSEFTACGDDCPVESVSWADAVEFAERLSVQEGEVYRLPTEAEWEYAARGGAEMVFAGSNRATAVGWIRDNSESVTHPGCQKPRNGYGLCDMTGNVWEWTADQYGSYPMSASAVAEDSLSSGLRVERGGSWNDHASDARLANRLQSPPDVRSARRGFRLVRASP